MKRLVLLLVALLVAAPAAAQVATVPVQSLWQKWTPDITLTLSVSLYGYTTSSPTPRVLSKQTVNLAPISLLQPEVRAEFPGLPSVGMTVMQVVVKSTADAPTFHSDAHTVAPKQPLSINVPAGNKVWVVYAAPTGQQGALRFYVGSPPPGTTTTTSTTASGTTTSGTTTNGTRISQVGQSFTDSAGNQWSLAAPNPAVEGGLQPVILRNGVVFGTALALVWQNMLIYALNTGNVWYSISPLATSTSGWTSTSAPA